MAATIRNGRNLTKKAELPAAPAAAKNGNNGKQQLDARTAVPKAATLAKAERRE